MKKYKSSRKYKCPYCNSSMIREELVDHVNKSHNDLLSENYTAERAIYESINGKTYGTCMICKKKVYEWNDKICRYRNLCDNPNCKKTVRDNALERHIKVYNKPTLLNDGEHQEKMLANRKISGVYTFSDGGKFVYTGKYERNALEFIDLVLNIQSKDIQTPGPILEYEYNGEIHKWITDIYYIPANLLIEIKDGGSNPNTRSMPVYREKQVAKETMITSLGKFNYIRLTNNNFAQLLDILADIKNENLTGDGKEMKMHINEEVGGMPRNRPAEAYLIPYGMNNTFSGFAYSDSSMDDEVFMINNNEFMSKSDFMNNHDTVPMLVYNNQDCYEKINKVKSMIKSDEPIDQYDIIETFVNRKINRLQDIFLCEDLKYYDEAREQTIAKLIENAIVHKLHEITGISNLIESDDNIDIYDCIDGVYAYTNIPYKMKSDFFRDIESLKNSGILTLMKNI